MRVYTSACVCVCKCMYMYDKNSDGFTNPTAVLLSYLVHKTTMKQPVISMPDMLTEIQTSEVFDGTLKKVL